MQSILFFFMVVIAAWQGIVVLAVVGSVLFSYWFDGRWLILVAVLLDAYFGAFNVIPLYTIGMTIIYAVVEILRPLIRTM